MPVMIQAAMINTLEVDSQSDLEYLYESGQIDLEQYLLLQEYFLSLSM